MKKTKFFSLKKAFTDYTVSDGLVSLGNIEFPVFLKRLGWRLLFTAIPAVRKTTNRLKQLQNIGRYLLIMRKNHGTLTTVKYLKAAQLAVQKAIAKDRIKSLRDIDPSLPHPRLSSSGLPAIIPLGDRRAILSGSSSVIRWWLTIFSVYRVLDAPGTIKTSTIVDSFTGNKDFLDCVSMEVGALARSFKRFGPKHLKPAKVLFLETSSPSFKVSWGGLIHDYLSLGMNNLDEPFKYILHAGGTSMATDLIRTIEMLVLKAGLAKVYAWTRLSPYYKWKKFVSAEEQLEFNKSPIGQLQTKKEAAGKVRVFAMVDVWTQSALKPLHDWLFTFLRNLPNDGLDQQPSIDRCMQKSIKAKCSFGYDLSAATDRLPITLQVAILEAWFGPKFAIAWRRLLVDRDYFLADDKARDEDLPGNPLRYAVGQPMGALSSWAMLAVTHHLLVQLAALKAGKVIPGLWYDNYEIIGDDVNIFDRLVAYQYLAIMEGIGVPINLSKSVVATNETFEFAKVTGHRGENVSAISWKSFLSQPSMAGRANIVYSLMNKGIIPTNLVGWMRNIFSKALGIHGNPAYCYIAIVSMLAKSGRISYRDLIAALLVKTESGSFRKMSASSLLKMTQTSYLEGLIASIFKKKQVTMRVSKVVEREEIFFKNSALYKIRDYASLDNRKYLDSLESITLRLFPYAHFSPVEYSGLTGTERPVFLDKFKHQRNEIEQICYLIHRLIFVNEENQIREDMTKLRDSLKPRGKGLPSYQTDIEFWVVHLDLMDRIEERIALVSRADEKAKGNKTSSKKKMDGPLKAFRSFYASAKDKPNFYYYKVITPETIRQDEIKKIYRDCHVVESAISEIDKMVKDSQKVSEIHKLFNVDPAGDPK